jgi:hypothetical protein
MQKFVFFLSLFWIQSSFAILGATAEESYAYANKSVGAKAHVIRVADAAPYTEHEIIADSYTMHEFVNGDGKVFAIKWKGAKSPDLSEVLGTYHAEYQTMKASQAKKGIHNKVQNISGEHVQVRASGPMRGMQGLIVAKDLVPAGVDVESLP